MLGYTTQTSGFLFGAHKNITTANLGFGLGFADAMQKAPQVHTAIQHYTAFLYGDINYNMRTQLAWLVSVGQNNYKQASSTYSGQQYLLRAMINKTYLKKELQLIPQINANYVFAHFPDNNTDVLSLGFGVRLESVYRYQKIRVIPQVVCMGYYDIVRGNVNSITALLVGGPVSRTSVAATPVSGQFGASLAANAGRQVKLTLAYDLLLKDQYFNNIVSFAFKYFF